MGTHPLTELAEQQHGLLRLDQARGLDLGSRLLADTRAGRWEPVTPVVYRLRGCPRTPLQAAMAAVLDVAAHGAALSHQSAAALWQLPGFPLAPHHVTLLRKASDRGRRPYVLHEPRLLRPSHVMRKDGIPVTTPARTLFDLASRREVHDRRLERALDTAWAAGLVRPESLERMLGHLARKGRPGIVRMRALLAARTDQPRPVASGLEARFESLCRKAGVEGFQRQVDLGDEHEWIGRVDYVNHDLAAVVEIDGDRFHTSPLDLAADKARDERLARAGYRVERIDEFTVWHRPDDVLDLLRRLRNRVAA